MIFNTAISTNQNAIAQIESQIAALQDQLAALQKHQQALQSIESAAQTAIEQVSRVIKMAGGIAPDEIAAFKDAIDRQFENPPIAELPSETEPESEAQPEDPAPIAPEPEVELAPDGAAFKSEETSEPAPLEVEAVAVEDEPATDDEPKEDAGESQPESANSNGKVPALSTVGAQQRTAEDMTLEELKEYCLGLGMTKEDVRLHGPLTYRKTWVSAYNSL